MTRILFYLFDVLSLRFFFSVAPEILNGDAYGHAVDWYALGVVACRMLTDKVKILNMYNIFLHFFFQLHEIEIQIFARMLIITC